MSGPPLIPPTMLSILQSLAPERIGVGSALQAHVGRTLVRRVVGFSTALDRGHAVTGFLVLGAPVVAWSGATWGREPAGSGIVPWANCLFTWWNWWVGDTIRVLVVTPLILVWIAEPRQVWRRRQLSVALPLCLAFGLVVVFLYMLRTAEQARITRLRAAGERAGQHTWMIVSTAILRCSMPSSYYASTREVSRLKFRTFVQRLFTRHQAFRPCRGLVGCWTRSGPPTRKRCDKRDIPPSRSPSRTSMGSSYGQRSARSTWWSPTSSRLEEMTGC